MWLKSVSYYSQMITVKFQKLESTMAVEMDLPKSIQLRDLQKDLCSFFKERFPKKLAKVQVYDKIYDEFMDYPFEEVIGEEIAVSVTFEDTTDPYFYDLQDRRGLKYTIEDEMEWEFHTARGDICLTFAEWLKAKTEQPLSIPNW